MVSNQPADLTGLPAAYRQWRASELGRITDHIEEELILGLIRPISGKRVLDVGCGDGVLSIRLAQEGAEVTGLDSDPRMLEAARRRAVDADVPVALVAGRAESLPFPDATFEVVVAVTVLCFVPEPLEAVAEMARVLRPGGRLVIGELGRHSLWAAKRRIAGWRGARTWRSARFRTGAELRRLSEAAGLEVEEICGAVYYPPIAFLARTFAHMERPLSRLTTFGAAFIALAASKPIEHSGKSLMTDRKAPPILAEKHYDEASAFEPQNLLREARRQKGVSDRPVPEVCVLDPDGDIVRQTKAAGRAIRDPDWACYHTELYRLDHEGVALGIVPCAVGAAFAVLIAEQLFASGCRLLVSVTSSGQLVELRPPPYFVLIERALRDEGTSYHYLPPSDFSDAPSRLISLTKEAFDDLKVAVVHGSTWTTDAPFRETPSAIAVMKAKGLLAVEMEAAALYAFAEAQGKPVLCFAHVTNQMAKVEGDFEKGEADGSVDALAVIVAAVRACARAN